MMRKSKMSRFAGEMAELVDLFCEGDIAPEQASRLEALVAESDEARQYLLDCFQVHCELAWELGQQHADPAAGIPASASSGRAPCTRGRRKRRRIWALAAMAAALLVAATLGVAVFRGGSHKPESLSPSVARIEQVKDVRWCGEMVPAADALLPAGSKLAFQQGLLEVVFQSGARIILQGPAEVTLESPTSLVLQHGKLTADVPHTGVTSLDSAAGFAVHTPNATVVDLGTRFGVACRAGQTDVEVFLGKVRLQLDEAPSGGGPQERTLAANSAVRVSGLPGHGALLAEPLAVGSSNFVQSLAGPAAGVQALVEKDPHLIHFYPFEGEKDVERLRDRRALSNCTRLDLHEVAMRDGDGGGKLEFLGHLLPFVGGPDPSPQVFVPYRSEKLGGTHGRGLQSQADFQPPAAMTIELLLCFAGTDKSPEGFIACAVTTQNDADHCGFLVTAVRDGELACLLDGGAEWLRSGFKFVPGRWYYVASTFAVQGARTKVNSFAADLGDKSPKLDWIVQNQVVPGVPPSGPLGIGKGFDGQKGSAYPWAGKLGLVAIYDTILDRQTLENHFSNLSPQAAIRPESAPWP
jgi:ferric-dicitrate binding protein FerR (iron transport regulator)